MFGHLPFDLKHFQHAVIQAGAELLAVAIDQVVIGLLVFGYSDDLTVDRGDLGRLTGSEAADPPEDEHDHDGEKNHLDHPTAGMFTHYVEHSQPLLLNPWADTRSTRSEW
ncbi:hypothetical protein DESC_120065 [Desulfosarcina cetonica]|nr:hypothetical protein DESC_120065 [Desulfosarcina cetonica]